MLYDVPQVPNFRTEKVLQLLLCIITLSSLFFFFMITSTLKTQFFSLFMHRHHFLKFASYVMFLTFQSAKKDAQPRNYNQSGKRRWENLAMTSEQKLRFFVFGNWLMKWQESTYQSFGSIMFGNLIIETKGNIERLDSILLFFYLVEYISALKTPHLARNGRRWLKFASSMMHPVCTL